MEWSEARAGAGDWPERAWEGFHGLIWLQKHAADAERGAVERVEACEGAILVGCVEVVKQPSLATAVGGRDGHLPAHHRHRGYVARPTEWASSTAGEKKCLTGYGM